MYQLWNVVDTIDGEKMRSKTRRDVLVFRLFDMMHVLQAGPFYESDELMIYRIEWS